MYRGDSDHRRCEREDRPVQSVFRQARTAMSGRIPLLAAVASGLVLTVLLAMTTQLLWAVVTGVVAAVALTGLLIVARSAQPAPVPVRVRRR